MFVIEIKNSPIGVSIQNMKYVDIQQLQGSQLIKGTGLSAQK